MRVVVTGAGGFLGRQLAARLAAEGLGAGAPAIDELVLVDTDLSAAPPGATLIAGSIEVAAVRQRVLAGGVDCLFHLAAIPGGLAERDNALGWRINLHATIALLDDVAAQPSPARIIHASTIAVFGNMPERVDDDTLPLPGMSYGAQKLMVETYLSDLARRRVVDARCVRLPGIVARPPTPSGHASAFMSTMFHALAAGERIVLPVAETGSIWIMSAARALDNLLHAATIAAEALPARRVWTLPALQISIGDLAGAIGAVLGRPVRDRIAYVQQPAIQALFAASPPLTAALAEGLGFHADEDATSLVERVYAALAISTPLPESALLQPA